MSSSQSLIIINIYVTVSKNTHLGTQQNVFIYYSLSVAEKLSSSENRQPVEIEEDGKSRQNKNRRAGGGGSFSSGCECADVANDKESKESRYGKLWVSRHIDRRFHLADQSDNGWSNKPPVWDAFTNALQTSRLNDALFY